MAVVALQFVPSVLPSSFSCLAFLFLVQFFLFRRDGLGNLLQVHDAILLPFQSASMAGVELNLLIVLSIDSPGQRHRLICPNRTYTSSASGLTGSVLNRVFARRSVLVGFGFDLLSWPLHSAFRLMVLAYRQMREAAMVCKHLLISFFT